MASPLFRSLIAAVSIGLAASAAWAADPSLHEVYQAAAVGNYRAAQAMMDQVLKDHPNSAKAHFVEAELLAKQGQLAAARRELAMAEHLAPGLSFAKPGAVAELHARLDAANSSAASGMASAMSGGLAAAALTAPAAPALPWGWLLMGGLLLAAIVFFASRNRNAGVTVLPAGAAPNAGPGNWGPGGMPAAAPGWGPQPYPGAAPGQSGGGLGSGILGGLATGAAMGAGVVAGEALMHRVLDGGHHDAGPIPSAAAAAIPASYVPASYVEPSPAYDMGGQDFGINDTASWEDGNASGAGSSDDDWL